MIQKNVSLRNYNTFGLNYKAEFFVSARSEDGIISSLNEEGSMKQPLLILGGGSNILFTSDFNGTIIHPEIDGIKVEETNSEFVIVSAGAGVNWDKFVEWTVNQGYGGVENLSQIPGNVGATPVQNIGAYGTEAKNSIIKVKTISIYDGTERTFTNSECGFGYRESIFKREIKGNYLITRVYFKLNTNPLYNLKYGSLEEEVNKLGGVTLKNIRQAVINTRQSKLPDPMIIGNAGSFFRNPVIENSIADNLKRRYPQMPLYDDPSGGVKVAAGWLIDRCGWKGRRIGDAGVHEKQALVLVNYGNATGRQIYDLSEAIKISVFEKFGIGLEREVEVIGLI